MNIDKKDIEQYLSEVREAVENDGYRIERNARRQDNIHLFLDYVLDEAKAKEVRLLFHFMNRSTRLHIISNNYEKVGGGHYDRAGKKRFLHRVQKRNGVPFAEEEH